MSTIKRTFAISSVTIALFTCTNILFQLKADPKHRQTQATYSTCRNAAKNGFNQRVISYSYFTTNKTSNERQYLQGIRKNLAAIKALYPGWRMRVYMKDLDSVPKDILSDQTLDVCVVDRTPMFGNFSGVLPTLWRFLPLVDEQVEVALFRDVDSLISRREKEAVRQWLDSKHTFHVMRDHPSHNAPMMAGMWGCKVNQAKPDLKAVFLELLHHPIAFGRTNAASGDQILLEKYFWPWAKSSMFQHDSYHCAEFTKSRPWPSRRPKKPLNFVGARFALNETLSDVCPDKCRADKKWLQC